MARTPVSTSPNWSTSTKIIVTFLIIAAILALLVRFTNLISTLITAFIFSVLFHPIAQWVHRKTNIPWSWSVGIIYLIFVIIIFGLILIGGIALINQIESLIAFLQKNIREIPAFFENLTNSVFMIGPFELGFQNINWYEIGNQLISTIEPILARMGTIIGSIATGAVGIIVSFLFSLLISFLLLTESRGVRGNIIQIRIPGYEEDFSQIGERIGKIWNEFLRGVALVYLCRFILYLIILSSLQLRFVLGMALIATFGNFVPYIGVAIVWIINFFIALAQGNTIFGLQPFQYALLVMGVGWFMDNMYDNFISPRIMANILKLHPAAVLIAVLIGLNLFGLLGMILAPPTLATIRVLFEYSQKKLTDQDPWEPTLPPGEMDASKPFFKKIARKVSRNTKKLIQNHLKGEANKKENP